MQRVALLVIALAVVGGNCAPAGEGILAGFEPIAEEASSAFETVGDRLSSVFGRKLLSDNKWESAVAPALEDAKEWADEAGETLQETFGRKLSEDKKDKFSLKNWQDSIAPAVEDAREKADKFGDSIKDAAEHVQDTVKEAFSGRRLSEDKKDKFSLKKWQDSVGPAVEDAREKAEEALEKFQDATEEVGDRFKEAITGRRLSEDKKDKFSLKKWQDSIAPAIEDARENAEETLEKFRNALGE
ncbi:hypothetical protein F751_2647 [Auxenochlorella protothecoides]|uniref:Uncharacterized protein n=1 Tax=Auxenochlorella protothecoides TaxID=3075 RepID=A0A087SL26_AUXPR|nr:hypothetical protein F751_2647 [Auxenochlorella protothecoides]KFM26430.1 hypothetical protein F751_2647 [Auxenochlorella protothecoides]RMZ55050.1 hypothetical protein APUTEX25_005676 [Auxenochlorella protothecoides]|eukprot:RMZ55050.1 hypothetical protein APUTEX25_005676 [Auxenochlorella protothecoides]